MPAIAEDLTLLVYDDDSGKPVISGGVLDTILAGAVLLELASAQRVAAKDETDSKHNNRLVIRDASPTGDAVLDLALQRLGEHDTVKAQRAIQLLTDETRQATLERLSERGLVREHQHKVLGLFPRTSWPAEAGEHEDALRRKLGAVLHDGQEPDPHTGALISLLHAANAMPDVVEGDERRLKSRAREISEQSWTTDAVQQAVAAVRGAVIAAAMAGTTAAMAGAVAGM